MAHPKYGCLDPAPVTKMYPVAASVFFRHNGVNAVFLTAGHVELAITATATLLGIAVVPTGMGSGTSVNYWKSSATAGKDKIPVIAVGGNYEFLFPADETVTEGMKDNACDLIAVDDGTATTVDVGTSSTDVFLIQDLGVNVHAYAGVADVVVKMNPAKVQGDT